jgi:small subunit ribosomal protein S19
MSRSSKKGPFVNEKLLKKISALKPGDKTVIKTWARSCTITPEMVGFTIGVHNGRDFIQVRVVENMVGHKLGEFSPTRKFVKHGGQVAAAAPGAAVMPGAAPAAAAPADKKK